MSLISLEFIGFCLLLTLIYYIVPGKLQNLCLLAANILFLLPLSNFHWTILFLGISIVSVYAAGIGVEHLHSIEAGTGRQCSNDDTLPDKSETTVRNRKNARRKRKFIFHGTVIFNLILLFLFRYMPFVQEIVSGLHIHVTVPNFSSLAPLGISFYTLQLLGYLINVNDGGIPAEHNFIRFAVFGSYFPQMTSGPISRYEELGTQFKDRRKFSYQNITFGFQRMAWGFFKKFVISERAAVPVNTVFSNFGVYNGFYIIVAVVLFAVQLYCDFSGCMDIVIGMSEALGITLPENFITPFFSCSMTEFWRRWHITLGTWCRDYIFYPLQKTDLFYRIRQASVKRFGRKKGRKVPMYLAMFIMWFCVGFWHGGLLKYIIGSGLLHFCYIFLEQEGAPLWNKINQVLHVHTDSAGHRAFQRVRTYLLVCSGFIFFRANSFTDAIHIYQAITTWNPAVFSMNGLLALGLDLYDILVLVLSVFFLWYIENLQQKGSVREMISSQSIGIRWILFIGLLLAVLIFGEYGSGFSSESFIYAQF